MKRRIISLLVSLVLIISMIPVSAMADDPVLITDVTVALEGSGGFSSALAVEFILADGATLQSITVQDPAPAIPSHAIKHGNADSTSGAIRWTYTPSDQPQDLGSIVTMGKTLNVTIVAESDAGVGTYTNTIQLASLGSGNTAFTGPGTYIFEPAAVPVELTLAGLGLAFDGANLVFTGVDEATDDNPDDTIYSVEVDGGTPNVDVDLSTYTIPIVGIPGDVISVVVTASHDDADDDATVTLTYTFPTPPEPTELTLDPLDLVLSGTSLKFSGVGETIDENPTGTVFTIVIGDTSSTDLDGFATSVAGKNVGDKITVKVTASFGDLDDVSKTFEHTVSAADYAEMHDYDYILKVDADGGVSGVTFDPNYADYSGGYYFFNEDTTVKVSTILYYSVSSATVDKGTLEYKGTTRGVASYDIAFPSNVGENGPVVTTLTLKTNKINIGDTAPTHYYTIKAYAGTGGTISPSGTISVPNGGNQSFIIVPNTGYEIESVVVNGVNRGALNAFTFTDVDADHSIIASFKKVSGTVTPTQPGTTLPPIVTPPTTIPATGATTMVLPGVALLLAGIALLPKRRSK
jgi:hypothetical protein